MRFVSLPRARPASALASLTCCLVAASALAAPQEPDPPQGLRFRSQVELVRLPVAVIDDGVFVSGLGAQDFRLLIDGVERELAMVQEVDLDSREPDAGGAGVDAAVDDWARRSFVLFVDTVLQRPEKLQVCVQAAEYLVRERLEPQDRIALVAFTRRGAILVRPFTTDRDAILASLSRLESEWAWQIWRGRRIGNVPLPPLDTAPAPGRLLTPELAPVHSPSLYDLSDMYLAGLHQVGLALQAQQGRKQLLLYSQGMVSRDPRGVGRVFSGVPGVPDRVVEPSLETLDYRQASGYSLMEAAGEALRDANVAVHALSTAALTPGGGRPGLHFLWFFSDETGGSHRFHTHHLEGETARAESLSRRYYLLGYRRLPTDPPRVNVDVHVLRDHVGVHAPTRMALPPPADERSEVQRAFVGEGDGAG